MEALKNEGFHLAIDTNGFVFDQDVEKALSLVDLVLLDIKEMDDEDHKKLTGVSNRTILEFARYLEKIGKPFWVRHVLVPEYTNSVEHLEKLGIFLKSFAYLERLEILPYHTLGVYKWKEL